MVTIKAVLFQVLQLAKTYVPLFIENTYLLELLTGILKVKHCATVNEICIIVVSYSVGRYQYFASGIQYYKFKLYSVFYGILV